MGGTGLQIVLMAFWHKQFTNAMKQIIEHRKPIWGSALLTGLPQRALGGRPVSSWQGQKNVDHFTGACLSHSVVSLGSRFPLCYQHFKKSEKHRCAPVCTAQPNQGSKSFSSADKLKSWPKPRHFLLKLKTSETEVWVCDLVHKHVCVHKQSKRTCEIGPYHPVSPQHVFH